jgi:hypothetical protein
VEERVGEMSVWRRGWRGRVRWRRVEECEVMGRVGPSEERAIGHLGEVGG